jgi:uncharacterized protein (UPF0335 family)
MTDASGIAADRLRSFIERIERLESEKAAIADDIKEIYSEAKSSGFETKIIRKVIALRKMDAQERAEQEQLLDVYMGAIGMLAGTPLGEAAAPKRKPVEGDVEPEERDGWIEAAPGTKRAIGSAIAQRDAVTIERHGTEATVTAPIDKNDQAVDSVRAMLGVGRKQQLAATG